LVVSVLFSEPKISQTTRPARRKRRRIVSVLFSEPKISQPSECGLRA